MAALTTSNGNPVDNNQQSLSLGAKGPVLLQDFNLIDKLAHFDRERIPERVVHAKGAGAHGYFEVTSPVLAQHSKAKLFATVGKRTPTFLRFSTVGGEKGSADTDRDPRGFALKFYTEEGNWDMTGNNTPVFFIRDPIKFPDFIHTQKRNARTNLKDPDAHWDFASLVPESIHQFTILFSDRGTPNGYRHLNGYSSHTLKLVSADGKPTWAKFHFKTDQKIKNLPTADAARLAGTSPDYATHDLFEAIERGDYPSWTVQVQLMPYEQALTYRFNPFDVTKVWPHKDFPVIEVGKLVLNRNPDNYFAEVEQAAFSPSHLVPGIEASPDKMLQGRLFSYPDTHRHRLGPNYQLIPINTAYNARVSNYQRDGFMRVDGNGGSGPNYEPNSFGGPAQVGAYAAAHAAAYAGNVERAVVPLNDDDFVQAGALYRLMPAEQKANLVNNIAGHLKNAKKQLQQRQLAHFKRADAEYGARVEAALLQLQQKL